MQIGQVLSALSSAQDGLSESTAKKRLEETGKNRLQTKKPESILHRFLSQFADFMILILLAAAGISFVTARMNGEDGFVDSAVILGIVILNAIIGTVQETKAQNALDALRKMSAPKATVLRDGVQREIEACDVVPGDVLVLSAGDRIPADARLLSGVRVTTQESALTGESMPCEKDATLVLPDKTEPADRANMLFSSTVILTGHCTAVVCETGMHTQIGKIAGLLDTQQTPQTPLQIKLGKVGKMLGIGALAICFLIFLLGLFHHVPILDSFLLSVSLAVAAIPEGLPAIVTVVLSMGVQRMAKQNAIVTRLPAVETLGSATVICSDKTGTLTQNRMTVTKTFAPGNVSEAEILRYGALCCNAEISGKGRNKTVTGEPTENAIVRAADDVLNLTAIRKQWQRVSELPFDSVRKRMSTLHTYNNRYLQITKGAPDVLLPLCTGYKNGEEILPLTDGKRSLLQTENGRMAEQALRVLAVAVRETGHNAIEENDLAFVGFIGMTDPPRPESIEAVRECKMAGIKPVMITGDHALTAGAVAQKIGICEKGDEVLTGAEIQKMSDAELCERVHSCCVYARVTPEHKVRIVRAFQSRGEIVAMTGDGVNDAPALKGADIGCAMGQSGTDVAKGAADLILTDDNFATIVHAVSEGRGIYDNIRKAVHFLLSSNVGEILVVFASSVLHLPAPLLPIQLLWVNLVTDSLPALALGCEPKDADIMHRPPLSPKDGFFSGGLYVDIALEGMFIGAMTLLSFVTGMRLDGVELARTMAFTTLSLGEISYAVSMRSEQPIFKVGLLKNKKMVWAVILCTLLQVAVLTLPTPASLLQTVPLQGKGLLWSLLFAGIPFLLLEVEKLLRRKRSACAFRGFLCRVPGRRFRQSFRLVGRSRRNLHGNRCSR